MSVSTIEFALTVVMERVGGFALLSDEQMDRLQEARADDPVEFNRCPECRLPMRTVAGGYECRECGLSVHLDGEAKDCVEDGVSNLKMTFGGKVYNISSDYSYAQRKSILDQLLNNNREYKAGEIPRDVLTKAASCYNDIQKKIVLEEVDENGVVCKQKKFVKRGNIKDEILGALVYYECIRAGVARKRKDIAVFMQLQSNGFSRGEDILRMLANRGEIDIPINSETGGSFTDRYLEALKIESDRNRGFVNDLVMKSISKKIGMNSVMSSKIVGAIWILIQRTKMPISAETVQNECDNIKKNTWMRFSNAVTADLVKFVEVFEKYGIDHGLRVRLVKK